MDLAESVAILRAHRSHSFTSEQRCEIVGEECGAVKHDSNAFAKTMRWFSTGAAKA